MLGKKPSPYLYWVMTCAACAVSVESMVKSLFGVQKAEVNYATQTVKVDFDCSSVHPSKFKEAVPAIGYDLILDTEKGKEAQKNNYKTLKRWIIATSILTNKPINLSIKSWKH